MAIELSIKVKGSEKSYSHNQVLYVQDGSPIGLSYNDETLIAMRREALDEFKKISPDEAPEDVIFKFKMVWD